MLAYYGETRIVHAPLNWSGATNDRAVLTFQPEIAGVRIARERMRDRCGSERRAAVRTHVERFVDDVRARNRPRTDSANISVGHRRVREMLTRLTCR